MASDWVAPVITGAVGMTGIFFTWLTGRQGRIHLEHMAEQAQLSQSRARVFTERREAYLNVLKVAQTELRLKRYERDERMESIRRLEDEWPSSKRAEMARDAQIAVDLFGSEDARVRVIEWQDEVLLGDERGMKRAYLNFRELARRELVELQQPEFSVRAPS